MIRKTCNIYLNTWLLLTLYFILFFLNFSLIWVFDLRMYTQSEYNVCVCFCFAWNKHSYLKSFEKENNVLRRTSEGPISREMLVSRATGHTTQATKGQTWDWGGVCLSSPGTHIDWLMYTWRADRWLGRYTLYLPMVLVAIWTYEHSQSGLGQSLHTPLQYKYSCICFFTTSSRTCYNWYEQCVHVWYFLHANGRHNGSSHGTLFPHQ